MFFVCGSQLLFLSSGSLVPPHSVSFSLCLCLSLSPVCFLTRLISVDIKARAGLGPVVSLSLVRTSERDRPTPAALADSRRHCANVPGGTEERLVWRGPASPAVARGARMASVLSQQPQPRHCAPRLDIVYVCVRLLASSSTKDFCLCPNDQQQKRQQTRGGGASQFPIRIVLGKFRAVWAEKWKIKKVHQRVKTPRAAGVQNKQ